MRLQPIKSKGHQTPWFVVSRGVKSRPWPPGLAKKSLTTRLATEDLSTKSWDPESLHPPKLIVAMGRQWHPRQLSRKQVGYSNKIRVPENQCEVGSTLWHLNWSPNVAININISLWNSLRRWYFSALNVNHNGFVALHLKVESWMNRPAWSVGTNSLFDMAYSKSRSWSMTQTMMYCKWIHAQ